MYGLFRGVCLKTLERGILLNLATSGVVGGGFRLK